MCLKALCIVYKVNSVEISVNELCTCPILFAFDSSYHNQHLITWEGLSSGNYKHVSAVLISFCKNNSANTKEPFGEMSCLCLPEASDYESLLLVSQEPYLSNKMNSEPTMIFLFWVSQEIKSTISTRACCMPISVTSSQELQ